MNDYTNVNWEDGYTITVDLAKTGGDQTWITVNNYMPPPASMTWVTKKFQPKEEVEESIWEGIW